MLVNKGMIASSIIACFALSGCGGGSSSNSPSPSNEQPDNSVNKAPTAVIVAPQNNLSFGFIDSVLDGSTSSDEDGAIVRYQWAQIEGEAVVIEDATQPQLHFKAPNMATSLTFELTVTDDKGATAQTTVSLENKPYFLQVGAGTDHHCALVQDASGKAVYCWGDNASGQLDVPALVNPSQLQSGGYANCALDDEGLKCWGSSSISSVPELVGLQSFSVGAYHACALDEQGVKCWGFDYQGSLDVPTLSNPTVIAAGRGRSCAKDAVGVKCWGGWLESANDISYTGEVSQLYVANNHTCAKTNEGLTCWGSDLYKNPPSKEIDPQNLVDATVSDNFTCVNSNNSQGENAVECFIAPDQYFESSLAEVPELSGPRQLSAAWNHVCAIDNTGVQCWGAGYKDQTNPPAFESVKELTSGYSHSCVIGDHGDDKDQLRCWGDDLLENYELPTVNNVSNVAANDLVTCVIAESQPRCWGMDPVDMATAPNFPNPEVPREVDIPVMENITDISPGYDSICAITNGSVECWGDPWGYYDVPQLTNTTELTSGDLFHCAISDQGINCWGSYWGFEFDVPTPELTLPTSISAQDSAVCAIAQEKVHCWGNGSLATADIPALTHPVKVVAGALNACALDDSGVVCWGVNRHGVNRVPPLLNPSDITVGYGYACAKDDSGLVCWGFDGFGGKPVPTREQAATDLAQRASKVQKAGFEPQQLVIQPKTKQSLAKHF